MTNKSPEAFRTISEVADWLGVPTHVLRFWESRFAQVKPVKRAGGRRYYRPADMALLGGIRKLLHDDGMTIRGVQKLLREEGVKYVAALSPPLDDSAMRDVTPANVVSLEEARGGEGEAAGTGQASEPPAPEPSAQIFEASPSVEEMPAPSEAGAPGASAPSPEAEAPARTAPPSEPAGPEEPEAPAATAPLAGEPTGSGLSADEPAGEPAEAPAAGSPEAGEAEAGGEAGIHAATAGDVEAGADMAAPPAPPASDAPASDPPAAAETATPAQAPATGAAADDTPAPEAPALCEPSAPPPPQQDPAPEEAGARTAEIPAELEMLEESPEGIELRAHEAEPAPAPDWTSTGAHSPEPRPSQTDGGGSGGIAGAVPGPEAPAPEAAGETAGPPSETPVPETPAPEAPVPEAPAPAFGDISHIPDDPPEDAPPLQAPGAGLLARLAEARRSGALAQNRVALALIAERLSTLRDRMEHARQHNRPS